MVVREGRANKRARALLASCENASESLLPLSPHLWFLPSSVKLQQGRLLISVAVNTTSRSTLGASNATSGES